MTYESALNALGDPTRRRIFEIVARAPMAVGDIARRVPVSQPAVSQHLRVLREAGLVESDEQGRRRVYRPAPGGLEPLRAYLDRMWGDVLEAYREAATRTARNPKEEKP
jgi:DNA-binding transcriptional ArsR family regulator